MSNVLEAKPVTVTYLTGKTEIVALAPLTIRQLYQWSRFLAQRDTPALVALCVGRSLEWVDSLDVDSFAALASQAVALNFQKAMPLLEADPVMAASLAPLLAEAAKMLTTISATSSTTPPPSVSVAATTNDCSTSLSAVSVPFSQPIAASEPANT